MKPEEQTIEETANDLGIPATVRETTSGQRVIITDLDDDEVEALSRNVE